MELMEAIDLDQYSKLKFYERFKLERNDLYECVINKCEDLAPYHELVFEEYNVDILTGGVKFNLKIITSKNEKDNFVRKIIARAINQQYSEEVLGCLNHIKRKRDVEEAMNLFVTYGTLHEHRRKIKEFILESEREFFHISDKKDGIFIKCAKDSEFYFELNWTIWWNCRSFSFLDVYDVRINKGHVQFYQEVKPVIIEMIKPALDYNSKKARWTIILIILRDYLNLNTARLTNVINFNEQLGTTIEITDSDDDDDVLYVDASESFSDTFIVD